jgi:hypothetical protein
VTDPLTGETATDDVALTVTPVNDAPVLRNDIASVLQGETVLIDVLANDSDIDDDALDIIAINGSAPGESGGEGGGDYYETANGVVWVEGNEVFFTPNEGFFGVETFSYTASDGEVERTASVTVVVQQDPADFPDELPATLTFNVDAVDGNPAGFVEVEVLPVDSTGVNVVFALDSSGSIGSTGWTNMITSVKTAAQALADDFGPSATPLDVHIVSFSSGVAGSGPDAPRSFAIAGPGSEGDGEEPSGLDQLNAYLDNLTFQAGLTNWVAALQSATAFFDAQETVDPAESNFMYFITDGEPVGGSQTPEGVNGWGTLADALRAAPYDVSFTAFGIIGATTDTLQRLEGEQGNAGYTATILTDTTVLASALEAEPLFNAQMVDFSLLLTRDGEQVGEIADMAVFGGDGTGITFSLPLAEIPGLSGLLGDENVFTAISRFDLDGDPATTADQVQIVAQAEISKNAAAQVKDGSDGNDLLLGSDLDDVMNGLGGGDPILGGGDLILGFGGDDRLTVESRSAAALDGGSGRDVLTLLTGGETIDTPALAALNISDIEVLDVANGDSDLLLLTGADVLGLSSTGDLDLEALLDAALGDIDHGIAVSVHADGSDQFVLIDDAGGSFTDTGVSVTDADGVTLDVYQYSDGTGAILATLAMDVDAAPAAVA